MVFAERTSRSARCPVSTIIIDGGDNDAVYRVGKRYALRRRRKRHAGRAIERRRCHG